jgi:hypothetical protein
MCSGANTQYVDITNDVHIQLTLLDLIANDGKRDEYSLHSTLLYLAQACARGISNLIDFQEHSVENVQRAWNWKI